MPDLVMYLTEDDQRRFVDFVLGTGAFLIPDMHVENPSFPTIVSLAQYESYRARLVSKYYIQRDDFTRFSPTARSIQQDGRMIYYVSQREGGPFVDFSGGGTHQENDCTVVRAGGFGHYPTYFQADVEYPAPETLKRYHAELRKYLLRGAMRLGRTKTKPWILAGAVEAIHSGGKLGGFESHGVNDLQRR